jgi:hypothetical protein
MARFAASRDGMVAKPSFRPKPRYTAKVHQKERQAVDQKIQRTVPQGNVVHPEQIGDDDLSADKDEHHGKNRGEVPRSSDGEENGPQSGKNQNKEITCQQHDETYDV